VAAASGYNGAMGTETPPHPHVAEVLIPAAALAARVAELGQQISADYAGRELHLVGILKGAVTFLADLARAIAVPATFDFMAISSYGRSTRTSGVVRFLKDLDESIEGRHVLIVEDIVDTGLTLHYLRQSLAARRPASLAVAVALDKAARRQVDVPVEYVGFPIPDAFVVGYGLDYAGRYRNLPYVGVLRREVYAG
jgi:hypoxanthine phosphoribosyltransferase